jgi:tetratricopeptide (TPR) repeat protein
MKLIFTIFILFIINSESVLFAQKTISRKHHLETFIEKNIENSDTTALSLDIKQSVRHSQNATLKEDFQILENVLLANSFARTDDALNAKSDTLFLSAIEQSSQLQKKDLHIWAMLEYGFYLYTYRLPAKAMPYFVRVIHDIERLSESERLNTANSYKKIAYFNSTLGNEQESFKYLKLAQKYVKPGSKDSGDILNSIGRFYFRNKDYDQADEYYRLALTESRKCGDHIREAKIFGDMAELYQSLRQYDKAEEALLQDIALSQQFNNPQNTMYAHMLFGKLMLEQDKLTKASAAINEALVIARSKPYLRSSEYEIMKLHIILCTKRNDDIGELLSRRRLDTLEKQIAQFDGKSILQQVSIETQKEILNLSLEAERNKLRQEKVLRRVSVVIGLLLLLTVLFVIIAYRRRNKLRLTNYENRVMKLQLEKITSENKLNETRKSLSDYKEYLVEKNDQIEALRLEIEDSKSSSLSSIETHKGKLQELLQSHLMSEHNWQTFKEVYIQEEPVYYQYIIDNFEGLTDSNMRILFLQKMGFNNPRIAQILGITLDAVKKNKQRMRKKYGQRYTDYYNLDKVEEEDQEGQEQC